MAATSVGAISMAAGFDAVTESTIGFCRVGSNFCGPCVVTVYPSSAALALMPHSIVM